LDCKQNLNQNSKQGKQTRNLERNPVKSELSRRKIKLDLFLAIGIVFLHKLLCKQKPYSETQEENTTQIRTNVLAKLEKISVDLLARLLFSLFLFNFVCISIVATPTVKTRRRLFFSSYQHKPLIKIREKASPPLFLAQTARPSSFSFQSQSDKRD
jgi:hypothetical protein